MLRMINAYVSLQNRPVLLDCSLTIKCGKLCGIAGPNGAGKTTLLKTLAGLIPVHTGEIKLGRNFLTEISPKIRARTIAYVPQHHAATNNLRVKDLVMLGRKPFQSGLGFANIADEEQVSSAIQTMELAHLQDRTIETLSGGEQQRAWIARALAGSPQVLLLDEPLTHLDIVHQHGIMTCLQKLRDSGMAIVCVLHDLNLATRYCDDAILINEGRIAKQGIPSDVFSPEIIGSIFGIEVSWQPSLLPSL